MKKYFKRNDFKPYEKKLNHTAIGDVETWWETNGEKITFHCNILKNGFHFNADSVKQLNNTFITIEKVIYKVIA